MTEENSDTPKPKGSYVEQPATASLTSVNEGTQGASVSQPSAEAGGAEPDRTTQIAVPKPVDLALPVPDANIRDLIRRFEANGVHPVMIFGTQISGKTMMVQSLIYDAQHKNSDRIGASLGESVFPADYPNAARRYINARQIVDLGIRLFHGGERAGQTQILEPFFVPITLNVKGPPGKLETLRFAFLESVGEWYSFKDKQNRMEFKDLNPEIEAFLKLYTGPISVIFVAPTVYGFTPKDFDENNACLAEVMLKYNKFRRNKEGDNLLLLISMWDAKFPPGTRAFGSALPKDIVDTIKGWFGVWNNYAQVIDGIREDARSLMPYAAAWIDKDSRILGQKQYEPIFRQFNQTLWNWLYANAKEAQASASSDVPLKAHTRAVLFPEVVPENPKMIRASLLGRLFTFKPWS